MSSNPPPRASLSHIERTAAEPRDRSLHRVILSKIEQINDDIRLLQLTPVDRPRVISFRPGQWLDVHIPNPLIPRPGGFTITSPPSALDASSNFPHLELAIQRSTNPPAAWLWQPVSDIQGAELGVRVGGSFVWPPTSLAELDVRELGKEGGIRKVVFVAGGVGINPLMSMLSSIAESDVEGLEVEFLYSVKKAADVKEVLFLERVASILQRLRSGKLGLFFTGGEYGDGVLDWHGGKLPYRGRRIVEDDLKEALGPVEGRKGIVCYVCGVPGMTDLIVEQLSRAEGMSTDRVLCEKWW